MKEQGRITDHRHKHVRNVEQTIKRKTIQVLEDEKVVLLIQIGKT